MTVANNGGRPDWRDTGLALGTRVRVALWLMEQHEVGHRRFSKQQLREALPGVEQIDRRMRDLRPAGWVIRTYRDMAGLKPDELFLEKVGQPVWEPAHRSAGLRSISAKTRRDVFERDGHRCVRCGITAREEYPDDPGSSARLTLGHVRPHKSGSSAGPSDLVTECARCNETARHLTGPQLDAEQVWDRIAELSKKEKARLLSWMLKDARIADGTELIWASYRQLPGAERDRVRQQLAAVFADEVSD